MSTFAERDRRIGELIREIAAGHETIPLRDIERVARDEFERLAGQSKFDDYVPVLARKNVREALRKLDYVSSPRKETTPAN